MPVITVVVNKPTKKTRVGLTLGQGDGYLYVKSLDALCAKTDLKVGNKLISINSRTFDNNITSEEAIDFIKGLAGEVSIQVDQTPKILIDMLQGKVELETLNDGDAILLATSNDGLPRIFQDADVPLETWSELVEAVRSELLPEVSDAYDLRGALALHYKKFVGTQMLNKGVIGFGTESGHELNTFQLHMATSNAHSNAVLAGANLLAKATALLSKYGIVPQLVMYVQLPFRYNDKTFKHGTDMVHIGDKKFSLPVGLRFSKV